MKNISYDFAGSPDQIVETFQKDSLSNTLTTRHTYDNWGRELATVSLLSGSGVNGTVKDSTAISYDALGRPAYAVSYPSTSAGTGPAVSSSLGYALQGWICNKGTVVSGAVGAPAYVERLRYDEAPAGLTAVDPSHTGMITSRADTLAYGGPSPFTRLAGYGYDTISRLTNVADNQSRTAYTYDGRGNILSALHYNSGGVLTSSEQYSYSGDRLTSRTDGQSTVSFTHDVMGRMTADGLSGLSVSYNSLDRPRKIASNGVDLANYSYLADGTLLSAVDGSGEGLVYRGSLIYRKDSSGTSISPLRHKKPPNPFGLRGFEEPRLLTLPPGVAVPSAQVSLTSLFGMGRGGSSPL